MYQKRLFPGGGLQLPSKNIKMFQYANRGHPALHGPATARRASYPSKRIFLRTPRTLHSLLLAKDDGCKPGTLVRDENIGRAGVSADTTKMDTRAGEIKKVFKISSSNNILKLHQHHSHSPVTTDHTGYTRTDIAIANGPQTHSISLIKHAVRFRYYAEPRTSAITPRKKLW